MLLFISIPDRYEMLYLPKPSIHALMSDNQQKILIIRLSAIGDVLRVLPALQVLKERMPHSRISWAVEEASKNILAAHPDIDEVIVFPKAELVRKLTSRKELGSGIKDLFLFVRDLRRRRFDLVFDFHGLLKSGLISFLSGARERVGFTMRFTKECNWIFNNRRFPLDQQRVSRIDRNLELLKKWGLDTAHKPPVIHVPQRDRDIIQAFLKQQRIDFRRPVIAVHPGTSPTTPYKRWETYRYAVVADKIIEDNAAQIIFTWANQELEMVKAIMALMKYRAIVAPATENLCQLAEIFRQADLYLGSDTGPMHLAAFVGIPVVALFGPTDHVVNDPYAGTPHIIIRKEMPCSPCRRKNCPRRDCMKEIRETNVIRAVNIMLESFKYKKAAAARGHLDTTAVPGGQGAV